MAVLAVIGGIDSRPRLGGLVQLKEWGLGTVSRIAPNGKVTVQCGGQQKAKICSISQVKPVRHWEREWLWNGRDDWEIIFAPHPVSLATCCPLCHVFNENRKTTFARLRDRVRVAKDMYQLSFE